MMSSNGQKVNEEVVEQLPTKIKSHLPLHLQPRLKRPLKSSIDVNTSDNSSTPAIVKRKQVQQWFSTSSPTDAFLSPCTQKLMKPKVDNHIQPLNLDENDGYEEEKQMQIDNIVDHN